MTRLTPSGMPLGKPFPENEIVSLTCPNEGCEYNVRVHQSTQEANMRQHKEKGCPLVTNGETPEVKDRSPLELQAPLCPEPCSDCSCREDSSKVDYEVIHSWYPFSRALSEEESKRTPVHSKIVNFKKEPAPSHSWEALRKALKNMEEDCSGPKARRFDTGATRDTDDGKYDYEGFFSPLVLERFAEYMHYHRYQSDGTLRDSDNWQRGIPLDEYMKSGFRHFMDWWLIHRGNTAGKDDIADVLCAVLFNVQGYLHELLRARDSKADEGQYR